MISFELTEPVFSKKKTSDYELSVLLGADSLSYCVSDNTGRVLLTVKEDLPEAKKDEGYAERIENTILRNTSLQQPYRKVRLALFNLHSTLVPERLYDKDSEAVYLERMLTLPPNSELLRDTLDDLAAKHVYAIDASLLKVLKTYFSGGTIEHCTTNLLRAYRQKALISQSVESTIFLNVRNEALQIFLFKGGELIFCNAFSYSSSKDFIYYVMLVYDQFNLKPKDVPAVLSGEVLADSEIYHLVYRYIRQVSMTEAPNGIELTGQWVNRPSHRFFDLFSVLAGG